MLIQDLILNHLSCRLLYLICFVAEQVYKTKTKKNITIDNSNDFLLTN